MDQLKKYGTWAIGAVVVLLLLYGVFLVRQWMRGNQGAVLPSAPVAEHEVKPGIPIKAKDKQALKQRGEISSAVASDGTKEITATGTKQDATGTTHVASVLDTQTGESVIIQQRPMAEFMARNAIGLEIELNPRGVSKTAYYDRTFGRVWDFYASGGVGLRNREDATNEWLIRAKAELRF
jgi:hypothetical protein